MRSRRELDGCRIVVLSSSATSLTAEELRRVGIDAALLKPVRKTKLRETLSRVLGERREVAEAAMPQPETMPVSNDGQLRVLVAEDNVVNQKVVRAQLRKLGYAADVVANGREAVEACERIPYDVVRMDCQMPEMDGFDASRAIRDRERALGATPVRIIALTANAMESDREHCLAVGMDDYLSKPVKVAELDAKLSACANLIASSARRASPAPAAC
jgi:CheY-like chemotaxis protein